MNILGLISQLIGIKTLRLTETCMHGHQNEFHAQILYVMKENQVFEVSNLTYFYHTKPYI